MLLNLPIGVLECILCHLNLRDKLSVVCSNKEHYELLKHHLWSSIKITTKDLSIPNPSTQIFDNIKHTVALRLYNADPESGEDVNEHLENYAINIFRLMDNVNPRKLISFTFEVCRKGSRGVFSDDGSDVKEQSLFYCLKCMPSLKKLCLKSLKFREEDFQCNWTTGDSISTRLQVLRLYNCHVSDKFLEVVVERNDQLIELEVNGCEMGFTSAIMIIISRPANLKKLTLEYLACKNSRMERVCMSLNLESIGRLEKLEYLALGGIRMLNNSLRGVWQHLTELKHLSLKGLSGCEKETFSGLLSLRKLEELAVSGGDATVYRGTILEYIEKIYSLNHWIIQG